MLHELIDLALEIRHRVERAAANRLGRDQREPALDLVALVTRDVAPFTTVVGSPAKLLQKG
jgi:hypothetical protein